jgi:SAM-dependent methyltransferase
MGSAQSRSFWEQRLAEDWTESGVGYRALGRPFNTWMYRVRREVFRREVARLPLDPATARILDVGSGTGFYVRLWHELGFRAVTGCDLTQAAVDRLRRRFPGTEFHRLDISDHITEMPAGAFDAVSCMDVLFHITDDEGHRAAIANLARLIHPGGWCMFSENFLHGPEQRGPRQVNRSLRRIEREVTEAGLEVVRRTPMFVLMNAQVDAPEPRRLAWAAVMRTATLVPATGWLAGALLFPLERRLVRRASEGPSTELMVCRRSSGAGVVPDQP